MEPVNPFLPTLRSGTPALLRRAGGLIDAVRRIQQESSAEYWYELAMASSADSESRLVYVTKSAGLLRYEIATICQTLKIDANDQKYQAYDSDDESRGYYFDTESFYGSNLNTFARLYECYTYLVNLADSSAVKADIWIELAELLIAYKLPHLANRCYNSSLACDNRLQTNKSGQERSLQLFNPELYNYSLSSKEELLDFIKVNFWYFLDEIIQKESIKNYSGDVISEETLKKIRKNKYNYEFSRSSYKYGIVGDTFDKLGYSNSFEISIKLKDNFKAEILNLVCPAIAGKFLSYFVDTSIWQLVVAKAIKEPRSASL